MFHVTKDSPKWCTTLAALTESLGDEAHTSPCHPSSISQVGCRADTCQSRWPRLLSEVRHLNATFTPVPTSTATPIACLTHSRRWRPGSNGHNHNRVVPHTRGLSPARFTQPNLQVNPSNPLIQAAITKALSPNSASPSLNHSRPHAAPTAQHAKPHTATADTTLAG